MKQCFCVSMLAQRGDMVIMRTTYLRLRSLCAVSHSSVALKYVHSQKTRCLNAV